jgi:uncharacterized membrane protein YtjA (UPF0391 family)
MLGWALTFLIIAIVAGVFGFGGVAVAAAGIAKIIFYIFLSPACCFSRLSLHERQQQYLTVMRRTSWLSAVEGAQRFPHYT